MSGFDRPVRVLRVIARLNVGGPALHVSYLSRGLDDIGYETTLVAGRVGESEGSMVYVADSVGVEPVYVPDLQREVSPGADFAAARKVLDLIHTVRPDVLHTHTAKAGAVGRLAALMAGRDRPKVVVHTFHGHVLRGYFGPLKTQAFLRLEQGLARTNDALIAVSPQVRDDLVALGVAPADRIVVIRLGLDLEGRLRTAPGDAEELRLQLGISSDDIVITWLGRMTEIKRPEILLEAFSKLRRNGLAAKLLLVGDGPLRPTLESAAGRLGIAGDTTFLGFRPDVGAVYAASDVVALTSANEGTPVTVIEAQAAGLPVVSTDVGGVRDVVAEGESGFVVASGDVDGVADRLERLIASRDLRRRLGETGRARAGTRYSIPRLVSDVDHLYRELLLQTDPRSRQRISTSRPLRPVISPASIGRLPQRADKLRVILVSQYFSPEIGATQSRMQSFAEYLSGRGHDVTVIAEFPNHPAGVIPEAYRGRLIEDDRSNSYRVVRVWVKASAEKTQMTRLSFYLSFMGLATAVAPFVGRADVVLATTPPLFTGIAGLAIARMCGAPFILDVRDLWPAAATSLMQISPGRDTRLAELIEHRLYRSAASVTAVTESFCRHIDAIRGERAEPTVFLPNGTLEQFFEPSAADRLGVDPAKFLVTFAGTLGIAQALPSAIDAAARVNGDAEFAFVGEGPMKDIVMSLANEQQLGNVHFHPQRPVDEIPPVLAGSDALLVSLSAHPTFQQFVPSKLIDFMAAGKPILLSAAGESVRLLETAGAGIAVAPEDPDALADAVRWLARHPAEAADMGRNGRTFAASRLRSTQAGRLEELMLAVVASRRH